MALPAVRQLPILPEPSGVFYYFPLHKAAFKLLPDILKPLKLLLPPLTLNFKKSYLLLHGKNNSQVVTPQKALPSTSQLTSKRTEYPLTSFASVSEALTVLSNANTSITYQLPPQGFKLPSPAASIPSIVPIL